MKKLWKQAMLFGMVLCAAANLAVAGAVAMPEETIAIDSSNFPDPAFQTWVQTKDTDGDGLLSQAERDAVTQADLRKCGIQDLSGLEWFSSLETLNCSENDLTRLELPDLPALKNLTCNENARLEAVDLRGAPALEQFSCFHSNLTELDLHAVPNLQYCVWGGSPLQELDLSSNSELRMLHVLGGDLTSADLSYNPKLDTLLWNHTRIGALDLSHQQDLTYDKSIDDVLDDEFYKSNFWLYWQTMFAFEKWHSALEMKLYLQRFIHHIGGLPDLSALKFTRYNQYESLILPLVLYLKEKGVQFHYGVRVTNVLFHFLPDKKVAHQLRIVRDGAEEVLELTENDLVFVTNGSCTESAALGDNDHAPQLSVEDGEGASWALWKNIAVQNPLFGRPEKFCSDIQATKWESATITLLDDKIVPYIQKICQRDPYAGKVVTGGIVTIKDSAWMMSWTFNRQPHFQAQPKQQLVGWLYGLYPDEPGDFVGKPMAECTGAEICMEWLYHLGVPENRIEVLAHESVSTIPCMMPYVTAFFMPRAAGDRPDVVPEGCVNFAFLGQFAQTERDTIFTTEYSVRTAMEAVYTLLDVERGVPEVYGSVYDIRCLLNAAHCLLDGRKLTDMKLSLPLKIALRTGLDCLDGTTLLELLRRYELV